MSTLLDDALSRSLRTVSHGFAYRELSENRIQLLCVLIHAILFDNRIPAWDLFYAGPKPVIMPDVDPFLQFIERHGAK